MGEFAMHASTTAALQSPTPGPLAELPVRLHHYAFVVRDQEINRRFF
jgi:hypothetical protein